MAADAADRRRAAGHSDHHRTGVRLGRILGDPRREPGLVHLDDVRGQPGHHALYRSGPAALVDRESSGRAHRGTHSTVSPGDDEVGARAADRKAGLAYGNCPPPPQSLLATGVALCGTDSLHRRCGRGVIFVAVEPGQDLSAWDGLWWAAETVTTVAYGDIYPTTALGRLVATVVMTAGIGFVALLTGALAQRFLYGGSASATPKPDPDRAEMMRKLDELSNQIAELQKGLRERQG